ncbi:hypothetical protein EJB05_00771, partial [Eragrostis curvula]
MKRQKSCNSSSSHNDEDLYAEDEEEDTRRSPIPSSRPPGRKQEKEKEKKTAEGAVYKKNWRLKKKEEKRVRWLELKAIEDEKLRIKKQGQDDNIMFMDTSNLDDQQKAYVTHRRSGIWSAIMAANMGNDNMGNDFNFGCDGTMRLGACRPLKWSSRPLVKGQGQLPLERATGRLHVCLIAQQWGDKD